MYIGLLDENGKELEVENYYRHRVNIQKLRDKMNNTNQITFGPVTAEWPTIAAYAIYERPEDEAPAFILEMEPVKPPDGAIFIIDPGGFIITLVDLSLFGDETADHSISGDECDA